ncbi:MAG: hypothetical protein LBW85_00400, partial [Deltaproteobacteria bacterium]|nr:hypothetical protein [Deltaproteobacteria bacterium]
MLFLRPMSTRQAEGGLAAQEAAALARIPASPAKPEAQEVSGLAKDWWPAGRISRPEPAKASLPPGSVLAVLRARNWANAGVPAKAENAAEASSPFAASVPGLHLPMSKQAAASAGEPFPESSQRPASGAESVFSLDPPVSEVVKAATPWNDKTLERALAAV